MAEFTKQRLEEIKQCNVAFGRLATLDEVVIMADALLAIVDQELVAYYFPGGEREIEQVSLPNDLDDDQKDNCIPLYAAPQLTQPAVETEHSSVIAEQLAHVLSSMDVTDHQRAVINCAVDRLNKNAEILQKAPLVPAGQEAILYEPGPTDSVNAPLEFTDVEDRAWVVGAEWMRDAFKGENPHLRIANDEDPAPTTVHQLPQPAVAEKAITQHFDTLALDVAKMVMCDVNRRHEFLGGDIQLLSRIQCRIDEACRAAMLQGTDDNSPVIPDGWVACSDRMPKKNDKVLIFIDFNSEYVPPSIHDAEFTGSTFRRGGATVNVFPLEDGYGVTHWQPLPAAPQQEA